MISFEFYIRFIFVILCSEIKSIDEVLTEMNVRKL